MLGPVVVGPDVSYVAAEQWRGRMVAGESC